MTKIYRFKPPFFYLLIGLGGIYVSSIFFKAFGYGEIGFAIIVGFFGLTCFALGLAFTILFMNKFRSGNLKVTRSHLKNGKMSLESEEKLS